MLDGIVFGVDNKGYKSKRKIKPFCKDLISGNLIDSREKLLEATLKCYEFGDTIGARFNSIVAGNVKLFKQIPEINEMKIIKKGGLWYGVSSTPECKCGKRLTKIEAEIGVKSTEEKTRVELFYFCYNCGFAGKSKKGRLYL
jgi:hypothetical protein